MTYVRTKVGFVYTAFVTDVFSRKIVGWSTRSSMKTEALPLEAPESTHSIEFVQLTQRKPSNSRNESRPTHAITYTVPQDSGKGK